VEEEGARLVVVGEAIPTAAVEALLALGDTMTTADHLEEEVVAVGEDVAVHLLVIARVEEVLLVAIQT
jgi:hypothetical protein